MFGSFLLAVFDRDSGHYQSICRLGTGFSDQFLKEAFTSLQPHCIPSPQADFRAPTADIDVWLRPTYVWEVKAADFSLSPVHQAAAGLLGTDKGIALRFPRFRRVRTDKTPQQATSTEEVLALYKAQVDRANGSK